MSARLRALSSRPIHAWTTSTPGPLALHRVVVGEVTLEHRVALLVLDELVLDLARARRWRARAIEKHRAEVSWRPHAERERMVAILHRDARCVAVAKPSGVATHRGWDDDDDALLQQVRDAVGRVRLSGASARSRRVGHRAVRARQGSRARVRRRRGRLADKRYLAITRGHPPEHVVIDHPIPRGRRASACRRSPRSGGARRSAATRSSRRAPHTGRLHQIRRHLKHIVVSADRRRALRQGRAQPAVARALRPAPARAARDVVARRRIPTAASSRSRARSPRISRPRWPPRARSTMRRDALVSATERPVRRRRAGLHACARWPTATSRRTRTSRAGRNLRNDGPDGMPALREFVAEC